MTAAIAILAIAGCLGQTLRSVGRGYAGHREAARWLASPAAVPGPIVDTRGLAGLYSGRKFILYSQSRPALAEPTLAYVVVQTDELQGDGIRARTLRYLLEGAERTALFAGPAGTPDQEIGVYRWHSDRFTAKALASRSNNARAVPSLR